ncbi:hypothetical protein ISN39_35200 (plasmid) [Rhizobium sp. 007]|nr:hypothetical protein ISN39_35200 [Rhizobium sp. 007]
MLPGSKLSKTETTPVILTDLSNCGEVSAIYAGFIAYIARACNEVKALPKHAKDELEAVTAVS